MVACEDVDLEVRRGEFVTLLGPSGSGKTTTLRMIAGFTTPTGGSIEIGGRDMTRVPPYRRNVGMVFQNYALFPHMTAAQNIGFPLQMRRRRRGQEIRRRVETRAAPRQARRATATAIRARSRAASSSGSRSPGPSSSSRTCC